MRRHFILLSLVLTAEACTTINSVTISQIPESSQRNNMVTVADWSPVILGIPFGSGFIDEARERFVNKCLNKSLEGVVARYGSTNYFLGLYATSNIEMQGYCVASSTSQTVVDEAPTPTSVPERKAKKLSKRQKLRGRRHSQ